MALSWNLSEGTNKKQKTPQSGYSETWPKFERDTPEYKGVTGNAIGPTCQGSSHESLQRYAERS